MTDGDDVVTVPPPPTRYTDPTYIYTRYDLGLGDDRLILPGNARDYTLTRTTPDFRTLEAGDFVLLSRSGFNNIAYGIATSVETVQFADGQSLSLRHLPYYLSGDAALSIGATQDDLLYESAGRGFGLFAGKAGRDTLYLTGNTSDYRLQPFAGYTPSLAGFASAATFAGVELVRVNGSGSTYIDRSVEVVQFANGQYLAYGDLASYVRTTGITSPPVIGIKAVESRGGTYDGTDGFDVVVLNGTAADYTLSRDTLGYFQLSATTFSSLGVAKISQSVEAVRFADGQYLSLEHVPAYVRGDATFTRGTDADNLLFAPRTGDSYIVGGAGDDDAYLNGNVRDYELLAVTLSATETRPAIRGYQLLATNGSGNTYIDGSTEVIHFQNGQYLAFKDLPAYILAHTP